MNKLFCSKNKKIVPDQTALNFWYKSLHATYLVILLSSADSFQNKYFQEISGKNQGVKLYGSRSGPNILLVLIWLQTVHECYQQMTKVWWSVVSKNGIYLGSAGQRLIWYLCKCIYYNIVTLFVSTSIHFYFTLLVGNYLGILSSAVFSKLIYYIVPSLSLSESQTVWIQIRSDILSVLIWF